jgi:2-dehydro-3-deoxyphosphooctonate aldolase (KDO 8-P synthase)
MKPAGFTVGAREPLFLIAGPCVIESEALVLSTAERLKAIAAKLAMPFVFKASVDSSSFKGSMFS